MAFNLEFKITYDELSPSLQALFKSLQTQITDNRNEITKLDDRVTDCEDRLDKVEDDVGQIQDDIEDFMDGTSKFYVDGEQGQVLKVDNKQRLIYSHDEFSRLRCVDTDEELQIEMKELPMNLENVFYNWYRYAHFSVPGCGYLESGSSETSRDVPGWLEQGQNLNTDEYLYYTDRTRGGWTYNSKEQTIYINGDTYPVAGFINTVDEYTNYLLRIQIHNRADGDNGGIVIGYYTDSQGVEHTLSILRGANACYFQYGLVYDAGNPNYKVIWNGQDKIGRGNGYCYLSVQRSDTHFEFKTTNWGSNKPYDSHDVVKECTFTFDLPTSKPSDWSQEMYDNIVKMLNHPNRVGFVVRSGDLGFKIDHQSGVFDDDDIYDLKNDIVWSYDFEQSKWIEKDKVHNVLSNRIFIYYPRKNYLYFYTYWNQYTKMILNPNKDILDQIKDQINNIQNNITNIQGDINNIENITNNISNITTSGEQGQVLKVNAVNKSLFADDNFYELNVFDNNDDITNFKNSFNYDINMKTIFDTWQSNRSMNRSLIDLGIWKDNSANNNFVQKNIKDGNWRYSDGYLVMGLNQSIYCTFISLSEYQATCSIEVLIQAIAVDDDDIVSIIFGYTEDNSNYYTLEYNVTPNKQNQTIYSSTVTYNLAQNGSKLLLSQPLSTQFQNSNDRPFLKMKIEKRLNGITVHRSYCYSSKQECMDAPYQYTGNYTYPSSKPSNWDDATYQRIGKMFGQSKIGFGTISWNCKFKVLSSNISELIGNSLIYNLTNDNIEKYKNNNWILSTDKVSTVVPYRVLLYNSFTSKLFYYYYKNKYVYIK